MEIDAEGAVLVVDVAAVVFAPNNGLTAIEGTAGADVVVGAEEVVAGADVVDGAVNEKPPEEVVAGAGTENWNDEVVEGAEEVAAIGAEVEAEGSENEILGADVVVAAPGGAGPKSEDEAAVVLAGVKANDADGVGAMEAVRDKEGAAEVVAVAPNPVDPLDGKVNPAPPAVDTTGALVVVDVEDKPKLGTDEEVREGAPNPDVATVVEEGALDGKAGVDDGKLVVGAGAVKPPNEGVEEPNPPPKIPEDVVAGVEVG